MKLHSAQEDIADLQTEFELERQDYLDTIRNQVYTCIYIIAVWYIYIPMLPCTHDHISGHAPMIPYIHDPIHP